MINGKVSTARFMTPMPACARIQAGRTRPHPLRQRHDQRRAAFHPITGIEQVWITATQNVLYGMQTAEIGLHGMTSISSVRLTAPPTTRWSTTA